MIILINGTSSSGKSTVCYALQKKLGWLNFSTDAYLGMLGDKFLNLHPNNKEVHIPNEICYAKKHEDGSYEIVPGKLCSKLYSTIPDVLELISKNGFNIIVDSFITSRDDWEYYKEKLAKYGLISIYLHAPEEVIKYREEKRGDRLTGSAIHWLKQFEIKEQCLLDVDTSRLSVEETCELIIRKCNLQSKSLS